MHKQNIQAEPDNLDCSIYLARAVIPVEPRGVCWDNHGICVGTDGRILALGTRAELTTGYPAARIVDMGEKVLLPGLVNTHTHAAMCLFRGLSNDKSLSQWLEQAIWPAEALWLNAEFVRCGSELAIAEMIATGTTCFNDMYLFSEQVAEAVDLYGVRALVGLPVIDFPTPWAPTPAECLARSQELVTRWANHPRLGFALSPHAPYTVSDATFSSLLDWHERVDPGMLIQTHLHESSTEMTESMNVHGVRPIQRLERLGLLERDLLAIHMCHSNEHDIDLCHRYKVRIAHCPQSNAHFGHQIAPIVTMIANDISVGLGTDGAASNNDLDLYDEMTTAVLFAKTQSGRAGACTASDALWMACMGGANALGMGAEIGSLEVGKWADFQAVEFFGWSAWPMLDTSAQLVYARNSHRVSDVWVAGRPVLRDGKMPGVDEAELKAKVQRWGERILSKDRSPATAFNR